MPSELDRQEALDRQEEFMRDLRQGKEISSSDLVKRTIDVLRRIVAHLKWTSTQDLLDLVRKEGKKIMAADPAEGSIGNTVRRILKIIREEYGTIQQEGNVEGYTADGALAERVQECGMNEPCPKLKGAVCESMTELLQEIEASVDNIASQALEHIHADATILTFGYSKTVEAFFKNAARKRKFQVVVCEGEPFLQGQNLAKTLAEAGIKVIVIPDTNAYAMMRKVSKVIIGTHTILAEGGCKVPCGVYNVAQAAKDKNVPVFVCAATYKLCAEQFISESQAGFQKWTSPHLFLPDPAFSNIEVSNAVFEYVPPQLIDLFIFNTGTNAPSHVYRLLKDIYHKDDMSLDEDH